LGTRFAMGCGRIGCTLSGAPARLQAPCGAAESAEFSRESNVAIGPMVAIVRADFVGRPLWRRRRENVRAEAQPKARFKARLEAQSRAQGT
jgi:hypothetical protein